MLERKSWPVPAIFRLIEGLVTDLFAEAGVEDPLPYETRPDYR